MAGRIGTKLAAGMRRSIRPGVVKLRNFVQGRPSARKLLAEVKSVESLVAAGHDPLHAAYICAQNYLSVFSELACNLSEFSEYLSVTAKAGEIYVPGWPPISPVSGSFFNCWTLLNQTFGEYGETICSVALDVGREFGMPSDFAVTLDAMHKSAMGIYEHLGWSGTMINLRDIIDGKVYRCIVPSKYLGRTGELWYVRLFPPLAPSSDYGVVFTSPYVLIDTTTADWLAFFERNECKLPMRLTPDDQITNRKALLKHGLNQNYWNEYVFLAYHSSSDKSIALCGIPDLPHTLPHASHDNEDDGE